MASWSSWRGFSDEELRKFKSSRPVKLQRQKDLNVSQIKRKSTTDMKSKQWPSSTTACNQNIATSITCESVIESYKNSPANECSKITEESNDDSTKKQENIKTEDEESESLVCADDDVREKELSKLEKFQQQQKVMEELNKKNKEKLMIALAERRAKAKKESTKLCHIQKELTHLDSLLSVDVKILRDKIEGACREFLHAQKHYEKAECEFITAKLELHKASELKEELTEHLYTIIHQNEVRKAQKLSQLMHELELETTTDELICNVPALPSLSVVNPCQVISHKNPATDDNQTTVECKADATNSSVNETDSCRLSTDQCSPPDKTVIENLKELKLPTMADVNGDRSEQQIVTEKEDFIEKEITTENNSPNAANSKVDQ
ncbi:uncharacterized protein LOC141908615 [Tubulanus polymorphus]|uniref:uncharacterized protein LOC141908615 n=1 Tax=Tubulanus polymorphus TaxID=672921 RepID=UPI003DA22F44